MSTALMAEIRGVFEREAWPKRYSTGTLRNVGANAAAWLCVLENPTDSNVVAVVTRAHLAVVALNNHNTYSIRLHPCHTIGGGAAQRHGVSYRGDEVRDGNHRSICFLRDRIAADGGAATAVTATWTAEADFYFAGMTSAGITAAGLNTSDQYEMVKHPISIETQARGVGIYSPGLQSTAFHCANFEWLEIEKRVWDRYSADEWLQFLETSPK